MSAEKDNPFARWSRLKLAARQAEAPDEPQDKAEASAHEEIRSGDPQLPPSEGVAGPDPALPPEDLPRIDDLTPESDLSAFLRRDIPAALKNTALRKMWSLDPAIRDYVGPADYAWDFNTPGSMRGFGALEAGKSVADFLSRVGGGDDREAQPEPEAEPLEQAATAPDEDGNSSAPDAVGAADGIAELAEPTLQAERSQSPQDNLSSTPAPTAADAAKPLPSAGKSPLRRHGSAVPR